MTRHYAEIVFAGIFVRNRIIELPARDSTFALPDHACGYQLFDREEVELDGEVMLGAPKNHSRLVISDRYLYSL